MSRHAFSELSVLKQKIVKKLEFKQFRHHYLLNRNKKNLLNVENYFKFKRYRFLECSIQRSMWWSIIQCTMNSMLTRQKSPDSMCIYLKENLENLLKNLPVKKIQEIIKIYCKIMSKNEIVGLFTSKFFSYNTSFHESAGDTTACSIFKNSNTVEFPELFQIYLENARVKIDKKEIFSGGRIINNSIRNFFVDSDKKNCQICLFEQILRILINIDSQNKQISKLYSIKYIRLFDTNAESNVFDDNFFLTFFYLKKVNECRYDNLFRIIFMICLIKKQDLLARMLIMFHSKQLIRWSKFKTKIITKFVNRTMILEEKTKIFLFSILRMEIILNNLSIVTETATSIPIDALKQILELDATDLICWLSFIGRNHTHTVSIDRLKGSISFTAKNLI